MLEDTVDVPKEGFDAESVEGVEEELGEKDAEGGEGGENADVVADADDEGEDEDGKRDQHGYEEEEDDVSNSTYSDVIYFFYSDTYFPFDRSLSPPFF